MSVTTVRQIAEDVAALAHDDGSAGQYLTDGVDLYRVLGPLAVPGASETMIAVEDCRTLDLVLASSAELERWRVRRVATAG
jgi:hypothetical protein